MSTRAGEGEEPESGDGDARTDLAGWVHAHLQVTMIALGHRLGLFAVLADGVPRTADALAAAAGLDRRYVREWLGATVLGGVLELDPAAATYRLPEDHAALLAGPAAANLAPVADMVTRLAARVPAIADRFVDGAGVDAVELVALGLPERDADSGAALGESRRRLYEESFVDGFLGAVPGLHERLRAGADVLDVGCGSGLTSALVARAFPRCRVVGVDVVPAAVARARAEHADLPGLGFREGDAADLAEDGTVDVLLAVDVVHDLPHPERALAAMRRALRPDGRLVLVEVGFTGDLGALLADSERRPAAADAFATSVLHCLPSSLAGGGAGWGAMVGRERIVAALGAAGFTDASVLSSPRPQNMVVVARPAPY